MSKEVNLLLKTSLVCAVMAFSAFIAKIIHYYFAVTILIIVSADQLIALYKNKGNSNKLNAEQIIIFSFTGYSIINSILLPIFNNSKFLIGLYNLSQIIGLLVLTILVVNYTVKNTTYLKSLKTKVIHKEIKSNDLYDENLYHEEVNDKKTVTTKKDFVSDEDIDVISDFEPIEHEVEMVEETPVKEEILTIEEKPQEVKKDIKTPYFEEEV